MTPRIPENIRTLFAGWSLVTIVGDTGILCSWHFVRS